MRTWCHLVAAILAAHVGAAFGGGYLRVTGPAPLCFQPQTSPLSSPATVVPGRAPTDGVSTNARQAARASDDGAQPCSTNTPDEAAASVTATVAATSLLADTNSSTTVAVESQSSPATLSQGQPAEQPPLTSQVLAEIFRHTAETSTNPSTTVVLPAGFMPPPPAPVRSSSATYTDQ